MLEKKQNVFDDFIAVAEHLVKEKYTSPAKLGIMGGSNGGLLVGAVDGTAARSVRRRAAGRRRDGHAALRPVHRRRAVGAPSTARRPNPAQFPFLIKYSPVQNVKPGTCYPATLVTTADHDDRVVPSHSFKFAAALQAAQGCDKPVLIRVEVAGLARLSADRQADRRARGSVGVCGTRLWGSSSFHLSACSTRSGASRAVRGASGSRVRFTVVEFAFFQSRAEPSLRALRHGIDRTGSLAHTATCAS